MVPVTVCAPHRERIPLPWFALVLLPDIPSLTHPWPACLYYLTQGQILMNIKERWQIQTRGQIDLTSSSSILPKCKPCSRPSLEVFRFHFVKKYLYVVIWTKYVAWCYFGSQYTKIALKAFCFQRSLCGEIWCSAPVDPLITEREILLPRGRVSYYGPVYCHLLCWSCAGLPHGSLPLQLRTSPCCAPCGGKLGTLSPGGHKALTILSFWSRDERERLFVSREWEGKLKITFPFYEKGTGIRKCYGKGRE